MWIAQGVTYPRTLDGQDAADPALLFGELSQESFHCRHGACAGPPPRCVCDLGHALYDCYALRLARARLWTPCFRTTRIADPEVVRHAIPPEPISRLSAFDLHCHPRRQTMGQSLRNFRFVDDRPRVGRGVRHRSLRYSV